MLLLTSFNGLFAQTTSLEFAKISGDGNPSGNGPVVSTTINFLHNTSGNSFSLYNVNPLSATIAFTNQQYDAAVVSSPSGSIIMGHSGESGSSGPEAIYSTSGWYGSPSSSSFTSVNSTAGTGISVSNNYAISVRNFNRAIGNTHNVRAKVYVGRMEITFNRPVSNPIQSNHTFIGIVRKSIRS